MRHRDAHISRPVWLLAAVAAVCVLGVGCGDADDAGVNDNNNLNNNNQTWPDGSVGCLYTVTVDPMSPTAGELVTARVEWTGEQCAPDPQDGYAWTVRRPDQTAVVPVLRQAGRIAEFTPTQSGTYTIEVVVNDLYSGSIPVQRSVTVVDPQGRQQTYLIRLTPPQVSNAPRQQQILVVTGGTPISERLLTLDEGILVDNQLMGPSGAFGGFLRFVQTGFSLYREVNVPANGQFQAAMLPNALYDVMILPDGSEPAPYLLEGYSVPQLLASDAFLTDGGEVVVGYVVDWDLDGVGGAQVALRAGDLPSSVGSSDSFDGRFVLYARPGAQGLEVAAPEGSAYPRVLVPEGQGIVLLSGGGLGLVLQYAQRPTASLDITVRAGPAGQGAPVPDARVTLEASNLGTVGAVTITQDGSEVGVVDAPGQYRVTVVADAQGRIPQLDVPVGRYRVVVEAPLDTPAGYGTTVIETLDITGLSPVTIDLSLATPTALEGWVVDELDLPVEGAQVIAVTQLGVGSAAEGTTDADGYFTLDAVAGATYTVLLMPPPGAQPMARRVIGPVTPSGPVFTLDGDGASGGVILPNGLAIAGQVVFQADGLGGVLVQAIPSGVAGDPVLAEAVTDLHGNFTLVVPDPGPVE